MFGVDLPSSLRIALGGALLVALICLGAVILPQAVTSVDLLQADDDPGRLAELRLPAVATEQRLAAEIDEALQEGDADLARSFLDLANAQGVRVHADRRARIETLPASPGGEVGQNFLDGVASGTSDTWSSTAGSVAADLVGISDVRDLWHEGGKLVQGESHDKVVLGLSAAGLALTGVTVASLLPSGGSSVAAKVPVARGLGLLKSARRAGLLSRELVEKFGGMALAAVDRVALREAVAAARALDLTTARQAARNAIRPGALRTISGMGEDMVALEARVGQRGAAQALGVVRDAGELRRARRLAEVMGGRTRAVLKLLGSATLALGNVMGLLLQAIWLALGWIVMAALVARRFGTMVGRLIWRPASRRSQISPSIANGLEQGRRQNDSVPLPTSTRHGKAAEEAVNGEHFVTPLAHQSSIQRDWHTSRVYK